MGLAIEEVSMREWMFTKAAANPTVFNAPEREQHLQAPIFEYCPQDDLDRARVYIISLLT